MICQTFSLLPSTSLLYSHNPLRGFVLGVLALLVLAFAGPAWSQIQLGSDIDGEAAGDYSGISVALSSNGTRVAIGAPNNDAGQARIYDWNGTAWTQLGADIDGEASGDFLGRSVALSSDGTRVAIGAPGNGDNAGQVRIYDWNGTAWVQLGSDIDGEAVDDESGHSVSLSSDGTRVAIGARSSNTFAGHVRIYDWNGTAWTQLGADIDGEDYESSGQSVSLSSDGMRVAIGAVQGNETSGIVRVYEYSGNAWAKLGGDIVGEAVGDNSGYSVALSSDGTRVAIGAVGSDGNGTGAGQVRIYDWNGTAWTQLGADIDGEASYDNSGNSVALSSNGTRVAIGAAYNNGNGNSAGQVRIYDWNGTAWVQLGSDIDGEASGDYSGHSVALSSDGMRVAIGAPDNDGNGNNAGQVRVYRFASVSSAATPVPTLPLFGFGILVSLLGLFGLRKLQQ